MHTYTHTSCIDPSEQANAGMWKKWDRFHKNISPGGSWNSTAWCKDYINVRTHLTLLCGCGAHCFEALCYSERPRHSPSSQEQFSPDERAFVNLLLQKDPRCRIRLDLLAKAARGGLPRCSMLIVVAPGSWLGGWFKGQTDAR